MCMSSGIRRKGQAMKKTVANLDGGDAVTVIHPDTREPYSLMRIDAVMPLYGLVFAEKDGERRTVVSRTIARVICETWEYVAGREDLQSVRFHARRSSS